LESHQVTSSRTFRVLPDDGGWTIRRDGNDRASTVEETKPAAPTKARTMAMNAGGTASVIIHRRDATVQQSRRYD
jgi:hypothetical protein